MQPRDCLELPGVRGVESLYIEEEGGIYDGYSHVVSAEDYMSAAYPCGEDSNIPIYTTYSPLEPTEPGQDYKVRMVFGSPRLSIMGENICSFYDGNASIAYFTVP